MVITIGRPRNSSAGLPVKAIFSMFRRVWIAISR
jgi:hypothetical protein